MLNDNIETALRILQDVCEDIMMEFGPDDRKGEAASLIAFAIDDGVNDFIIESNTIKGGIMLNTEEIDPYIVDRVDNEFSNKMRKNGFIDYYGTGTNYVQSDTRIFTVPNYR